MKSLLITIGLFLAGLGGYSSVFGAPSSTFQRSIYPEVDSTYEMGTSTKAWVKTTSDAYCLTGDSCISTWSAGESDPIFTAASTSYFYLPGRTGGQAAYGGTGSGDDLNLYSTSNATKGDIYVNDTLLVNKNVSSTVSVVSLYVNGSTGDDANDCTVSTPCATIRAGLRTALTYIATPEVDVYVSDGTYTESLSFTGSQSGTYIKLIGNNTTPTNVVWKPTAVASPVLSLASMKNRFFISGFRVQDVTNVNWAITLDGGTRVNFGIMDFYNNYIAVGATNGSFVFWDSGYATTTINGNNINNGNGILVQNASFMQVDTDLVISGASGGVLNSASIVIFRNHFYNFSVKSGSIVSAIMARNRAYYTLNGKFTLNGNGGGTFACVEGSSESIFLVTNNASFNLSNATSGFNLQSYSIMSGAAISVTTSGLSYDIFADPTTYFYFTSGLPTISWQNIAAGVTIGFDQRYGRLLSGNIWYEDNLFYRTSLYYRTIVTASYDISSSFDEHTYIITAAGGSAVNLPSAVTYDKSEIRIVNDTDANSTITSSAGLVDGQVIATLYGRGATYILQAINGNWVATNLSRYYANTFIGSLNTLGNLSASGTLEISGGFKTSYSNISDDYAVVATDNSLVVTSTKNIVLTMPSATLNDKLEVKIFQDSATSSVDIICSGGCLVNNSTTSTLSGLGSMVTLKAMNNKWYVGN